ncbi:MAG: 50S ribosomal protein L3 [Candidatus Brockarchaeota archaeon]|nr:50S ribosomal protein L3 [Candidatus Brockarchaeota archaeon]
MGHRRYSAPRRGSLAFRPLGRAKSPVARTRFWPKVDGPPRLLGFSAYKAGMTHAYLVETNEFSVLKGKEIFTPVTVLDAPPVLVLGVRAYGDGGNGLTCLGEAWTGSLPDEVKGRIKGAKAGDLEKLRKVAQGAAEVRAVVSTLPARSGNPRKKPEVFEIGIGGGTPKERLEYGIQILGKEIDASKVFKPGEYVDVFSVSKGKGYAGVIKRRGAKIRDRKSNKPRRGIATLGAWNPSAVTYTTPRGGQLGYWQRAERNKLIVAIGNDPSKVNAPGGFIRYGLVPGNYVLLKGSVPGPSKRLVKLRVSARKRVKEPVPPSVVEVALASPQGG